MNWWLAAAVLWGFSAVVDGGLAAVIGILCAYFAGRASTHRVDTT